MRTKLKGLIREEAGAALVLTLVLLVVGGLILAPLMGHVGTGHLAGQVHEKRMDELYAADAGVEYAIWTITHNGTAPTESLDVNGKAVGVDIDDSQSRRWHITSTAITEGVDGPVSSTTVTADLRSVCFADNAITSREGVGLDNQVYVEGVIQYGDPDGLNLHNNANIDKDQLLLEKYENWPLWRDLYDYYYPKYVGTGFTFDSTGTRSIDIADHPEIGPVYHDGDLNIYNNGPAGATTKLVNTVYVTENLNIGQTNKSFTLDLNGQTIFCEGNINIGGQVTVIGSGHIIAVGTVDFKPNVTSADGYVLLLSLRGDVNFQPQHKSEFTGFIMSLEGEIDFRPGGNFYGSIAGNVNVDLDAHVSLIWRSIFNPHIDFPFDDFSMWRLRSYNIYTETG